ncbi:MULTISPECIES: hypothetical protein [Thiorhodovibrio]|uniref:hypothetical protein n=1 Tax=Thiorhodovibrio TaxID=61593 RepID=UPI0019141047|nr:MULTISPECIES: hypothetical protein [Thiorhodovibrio]
MTKQELIDALSPFDPDDVVIVQYENDKSWDNIQYLYQNGSSIAIVFGGGNPFSDK